MIHDLTESKTKNICIISIDSYDTLDSGCGCVIIKTAASLLGLDVI